MAAVGNFFPSLSVGTDASYNFGRSIDPNTNTYISTTYFGTSHSASASMYLFTGGQLINQWRLAKVNRQAGMNNIQKEKDDLALKVLQAFIDVVYYEGVTQFAVEKLEASRKNLVKTQRQVELGLKGKADLVLIEAEVAGDDYSHTHYQNLYNTSLSTLKDLMNYPLNEPLAVDGSVLATESYLPPGESAADIYETARTGNPTALQAELNLTARKREYRIQQGKLFPTLSAYGGIGSRYAKDMKSTDPQSSYNTQFRNNLGEYVGISVSIPLFSRLSTVTGIRKARNNVRIAEESRSEVLRQLQTAVEKALLDREGYAKETIRMEKKAVSDEFSYQVTLRKYEEGLMSPLDVQTGANTLMESRANLLQRKLMYLLKCKEVDYYKGVPLINN
jgi:outer membrane protein